MKRKTSYLVAGATLVATLAIGAFAQAMPPHDHMGRHMPMTRTELQAKIGEQFALADTNKDGFVTKAEFDARREVVRQEFDAKRTERRGEIFAMLDKNHDGTISKDEFLAAPPLGNRRHGHGGPGPEDGRGGPDGAGEHGRHGGPFMRGHMGLNMGMGEAWFDRADAHHDGKLTLAEVSARPLAMFDRADTNHDGTISPEEAQAVRASFWEHMKDMRK
jgi:Ca2+-binding EF-hand superfamily protein